MTARAQPGLAQEVLPSKAVREESSFEESSGSDSEPVLGYFSGIRNIKVPAIVPSVSTLFRSNLHSHSSLVRQELAMLLYQIGTKGCHDFRQMVFDNVVKHAEKQVVQKPLDTNVFEKDSPHIVITDRLGNAAYHVNDIPAPILTDADVVYSQPQSLCDTGLYEFQQEHYSIARIAICSSGENNQDFSGQTKYA